MLAQTTQIGKSLSLEIAERKAVLEIQREGSLNALNQEVIESLQQAFSSLRREHCCGEGAFAEVGVVVLRGQGSKAFVAGADIKLMKDSGQKERAEFIAHGQRLMREIERCPLPVIALVQGFALGGGCELALACDLIVAGEKAFFGQPEVNLGLLPGFGGTQRLAARVGIGASKRLVLTGEAIDAKEAFRLGLVDYLIADEDLEKQCDDLCKLLLSKSPLALAAAKRSIHQFYTQQSVAGLGLEAETFLELIESKDASEGLSAFIEKRDPKFTGR